MRTVNPPGGTLSYANVDRVGKNTSSRQSTSALPLAMPMHMHSKGRVFLQLSINATTMKVPLDRISAKRESAASHSPAAQKL